MEYTLDEAVRLYNERKLNMTEMMNLRSYLRQRELETSADINELLPKGTTATISLWEMRNFEDSYKMVLELSVWITDEDVKDLKGFKYMISYVNGEWAFRGNINIDHEYIIALSDIAKYLRDHEIYPDEVWL